jgi:hypothetical protein
MLFVAILNARPGTQRARTARRLEWEPPDVGAEMVAEFWLQTPKPAVVGAFTAENIGQIWAVLEGWDEFFEISVYPAVEATEGLELLRQP